MRELKLKNRSTVAIIGGGPAGASCAIKLKKESEKLGIKLRIIIFEGKDFDYLYNQCVGVLSPPFLEIMQKGLGLELPAELVKRKISSYKLYGSTQSILLENNDSEGAGTYVVRRIKFDNFMLKTAKALGIEVVKSRTTYVEFIRDGQADEVRIFGERGYLEADVVVGAFGLDEAMLGVFEQTTRNYHFSGYQRPKKFLRSYLTKIFTENKFIEKKLGNTIYAFIPGEIPHIEFGAVTPKDGYIMVNIAGREVTSPDMDAFLSLPQVKELLPRDHWGKLDFFEGSFPIAPAENAYGDRYVTVGDSTGWMRPFKGKGINTAFITGMRAAYTMLHYGISRKAFQRYGESCRDLSEDYFFGMLVRYFTRVSSRFRIFDSLIKVAKEEKILYKALYNSVSGQESYKKILKEIMRTGVLRKIGRAVIRHNYAQHSG